MPPDDKPWRLSGAYQGWVRSPGSDWEDMLGEVWLECRGNLFSMESLEIGTWQGLVTSSGKSLRAAGSQSNLKLLCAVSRQYHARQMRAVIDGAIWRNSGEKSLEIQLLGEWQALSSPFGQENKSLYSRMRQWLGIN